MSHRFHTAARANFMAKDTPIPASLADAIDEVVHGSGKPPKALADEIGISYGYLIAAADANREDTQFQARLIVPATLASGSDAIVRYLAHKAGGVFVRVPEGMQADEHTARFLSETAEYLKTVASASADGVVTRAEAEDTKRKATAAIEALLAHVHSVEARAVDVTPIHGMQVAR